MFFEDVLRYGHRWLPTLLGDERGLLGPMWGHGSGRVEALGMAANTAPATTAGASSSYGAAVIANATVGNDGAWSDVGTPGFHYDGFYVAMLHSGNATGRATIDLALGAAGSENLFVQGMPVGGLAAEGRAGSVGFYFPVSVPSGTLIRARVRRSNVASFRNLVSIIGYQHPSRFPSPFHRVSTYGLKSDFLGGTLIDPGATANTEGTATTLGAGGFTNRAKAIIPFCRQDQPEVATTVNGLSSYRLFLASDKSIVLQPLTAGWNHNSTSDYDSPPCGFGPRIVNLPAATQVWAAATATITTSGPRQSQILIWGLD